MAQKLTGFFFSSYQLAERFPTFVISAEQYGRILADLAKYDPSYKERFNDLFLSTEFEDDIPKSILYVKLASNVTAERKQFIMNGVKSFFKGQEMRLFDAQELIAIVTSTRVIFEVMMGFVAAIAFVFTYFFVKVSAHQNLSENVWEYAQLRAIGLKASQGVRLCLYEQYIVISAAIVLGLAGGTFLSAVVTASFFLFTESEFHLTLPMELVLAVVTLGLTTTFFAVYTPIQKVNREKISRALVGQVKV